MDKEILKKIRLKALLTQMEFSKELGVYQSTVAQWETGRKCIGIRSQRKVLEFCKEKGIDVEKL